MTMRQIAPPPADVQAFAYRGDMGNSSDFNSATKPGWYSFTDSPKNSPISHNWYGNVLVITNRNNVIQIAIGNYVSNGHIMFVRARSGNSWTGWIPTA